MRGKVGGKSGGKREATVTETRQAEEDDDDGDDDALTRTQNKFVKNAIRVNILSPFKRDKLLCNNERERWPTTAERDSNTDTDRERENRASLQLFASFYGNVLLN